MKHGNKVTPLSVLCVLYYASIRIALAVLWWGRDSLIQSNPFIVLLHLHNMKWWYKLLLSYVIVKLYVAEKASGFCFASLEMISCYCY